MLIIHRPHTNPWFNIAAEEYLLKNMEEDCFMLWQNEPSIIVGKHQNTLAEINYQYVKENDIPVIRRISGGGTVFHDPGNLNFTFIAKGEKGKLVDFQKFINPIIDFLNKVGVPAKFEGKNDIKVNGLKISGNAEHVFKDKVLHHGTLLFSSNLDNLNNAIKARTDSFTDKAVPSNRSVVTNISEYLDPPISINSFKTELIKFIMLRNKPAFCHLSSEDERAINKLVEFKYNTWKWNFGYSPNYAYQCELKNSTGSNLKIKVEVNRGVVFNFVVKENEEILPVSNLILEKMKNHPYEEKFLRDGLNSINDDLKDSGLSATEILCVLF
jgi:lipoate-protein ligase A